MTVRSASHCVRCGRRAPAAESWEFLEWESWNEPSTVLICPACITSDDDDLMDAHDGAHPVTGTDERLKLETAAGVAQPSG